MPSIPSWASQLLALLIQLQAARVEEKQKGGDDAPLQKMGDVNDPSQETAAISPATVTVVQANCRQTATGGVLAVDVRESCFLGGNVRMLSTVCPTIYLESRTPKMGNSWIQLGPTKFVLPKPPTWGTPKVVAVCDLEVVFANLESVAKRTATLQAHIAWFPMFPTRNGKLGSYILEMYDSYIYIYI